MVVGLGEFLALARPARWPRPLASGVAVGAAPASRPFEFAGLLTARGPPPRTKRARPARRAQGRLLGIAAATGFGFVAAVVKELSAHLSQGPGESS